MTEHKKNQQAIIEQELPCQAFFKHNMTLSHFLYYETIKHYKVPYFIDTYNKKNREFSFSLTRCFQQINSTGVAL
jgi:hypothetical protein